jgi:hypothetical protein
MGDAFGAAGDAPELSLYPGVDLGLARGPAGETAGSAPHPPTRFGGPECTSGAGQNIKIAKGGLI